MHYRIRSTDFNLSMLAKTADECNFKILMNKGPYFVACGDCIDYPSDHVGLKTVSFFDCDKADDDETCIICGD